MKFDNLNNAVWQDGYEELHAGFINAVTQHSCIRSIPVESVVAALIDA
jgi:hypothetical protein